MQEAKTWQNSLSRVVLGLLLAGAVYLLLESLGFGNTRKQRELTLLLPTRGLSQVEVVYLVEQEPVRQVTLPVKGATSVSDSAKLLPGRYDLQIILRGEGQATVSPRALQINDEETLTVDLRQE